MDFLSKLNTLPFNIQDILYSSFGAKINRKIAEKHELSDAQSASMIDLMNDVFTKTIKISELPELIISKLKISPSKYQKLAQDIVGYKFLIADDYFNGEALKYLMSTMASVQDYQEVIVQTRQALKKEREVYNEALKETEIVPKENDILDENVYYLQSKEDTLTLIKEDIDKLLKLDSELNEVIKEYNDDLVELLGDSEFKKSLEKILANSQKVITSEKLIIGEETKNPTVANWLKDFMIFSGGQMLSDLALAEFLVKSKNAKNISAKEKMVVSRLLKLYKNISFFPESMGNNPEDTWEIIPLAPEIDKPADNQSDARSINSKKEEGKVEKAPSFIDEMEKILKEYNPSSLEYKAISQEILRLKKVESRKNLRR